MSASIIEKAYEDNPKKLICLSSDYDFFLVYQKLEDLKVNYSIYGYRSDARRELQENPHFHSLAALIFRRY